MRRQRTYTTGVLKYIKIYGWMSQVQDVALSNALWEALPGGDIIANKCIVTPEEAFKGPDTKNKRLCREYANSIGNEEEEENGNYKNPHCAMLSNENILVNSTVVCHRDGRLPSRMSSMIFIFSRKARFNLGFRDSAVRLEVSCANNEIYDPFKGDVCQSSPMSRIRTRHSNPFTSFLTRKSTTTTASLQSTNL